MSSVEVIQGFSLLNRSLLYTSLMLSPAQFISGIENHSPTNIMFLAYNWYNQITWYRAVQAKQLHALSLLLVHFNTINAFTYLGGISSGNSFIGICLVLGTAGVLILNTVAAWLGWASNLPEGFDSYQFFFFGWRTLDPRWHKFFLLWQIGDSCLALSSLIIAIRISRKIADFRAERRSAHPSKESELMSKLVLRKDIIKYSTIPIGAAAVLILCWPLILWTELIIARNNIESASDTIAVALFAAQVGTLLLPSSSFFRSCIMCNR